MSAPPEQCPLCKKGKLRTKTKNHMITVGGEKYVANVDVLACSKCKNSLFSGAAMATLEKGIVEAIVTHGVPSGAGFKYMRKILGFKAAEVAIAFDVRPETVSKWETEKWSVPRSAYLLLCRFVLDWVAGKEIKLVFDWKKKPQKDSITVRLAPQK